MSKLVTVFGGTGFLGRYVVRRLAKEGWRVRVAVRDPNLALFLKPYGVVGQIELMPCNIRDDVSVARSVAGADAVINCVGVIEDRGANTMEAVHHEGAARVARHAARAGVQHLVHVSARLGVASEYHRSKAAGEVAVREAFAKAVVLRPAVMFGKDDAFFNRLAGMTRFGPVLPLIGGAHLSAPVWVEDVAAAAVAALAKQNATYELQGPEVKSLCEWAGVMLGVVRRRRILWDVPLWVARPAARVAALAHRLSLGLLPVPVTPDQVKILAQDSLAPAASAGFEALGISPVAAEAVLPDYLWRFRPSGQFNEIRDSARNLRT